MFLLILESVTSKVKNLENLSDQNTSELMHIVQKSLKNFLSQDKSGLLMLI